MNRVIAIIFVGMIARAVFAGVEEAPAEAVPVKVFPLPANTTFERHVVGEGVSAATGERLIYSNTLGTFAAALGVNRLVSDDITTTVPNNCRLRRYEFPVVGKVNPAGIGGPYTVEFAMYKSCPGSVPSASLPALVIPGTFTTLDIPDDAPRLITFVTAANVPIPTNFWFGVKFSRNNAGVVFGTPPMTGFSCDQFDYPVFPCNAFLGGFPGQPQASFNLEIYADSECASSFTSYKNHRPSGRTYTPGANIHFADDIQLSSATCSLVGYDVAIKGQASYEFEIRNNCDSGFIAGTQRNFIIGSGTDTTIARFTFAQPIPLPQNFWFVAKINNNIGKLIISGQQACIGSTVDRIDVIGENGCTSIPSFSTPIHRAFDLAITCAGSPPVGACCDILFNQCVGGLDDGRLCCPAVAAYPPFCAGDPAFGAYPPCTLPGTCEAVCREVPQVNCPWPPRFTASQPGWVEGATCDSEPFPLPCGAAACCRPDQVCENLTQNECNAVPPIDRLRQWQIGRYCDQNGQRCPILACLAREGDCLVAHQEAGCEHPECCTDVCNTDGYCCLVEWDRVCVQLAEQMCPNAVGHDECLVGPQSALLVEADSSTFMSNLVATESESDPGFCCRGDTPGATGFGTTWIKFVATDTSARVSTCNSAPSNDSLLQVFVAGDPSSEEAACNSLTMIGCSDDVEGCSTSGHHGRVCIKGLTPGDTYYVMLAAKTPETKGLYELEIRSPCFEEPIWNPNDCNENKLQDGCEIGRDSGTDCNLNRILDECEITEGTSLDCNGDLLPDECASALRTIRPDAPNSSFGRSLAIEGEWLVVGEPEEPREWYQPPSPGAAYLFRRTGLVSWKRIAKLTSPDPGMANFAESVTIVNGRALITARQIDAPQVGVAGAVYEFTCGDDVCHYDGKLEISDLAEFARAVCRVSASGDRVAVSACSIDGPVTAVVYVFKRKGMEWVEDGKVVPPSAYQSSTSFGRAISLDNKRLAVGAGFESRSDYLHLGAVYLYDYNGVDWVFIQRLTSPSQYEDRYFGAAIDLHQDRLVVAAVSPSEFLEGPKRTAYVFSRVGDVWIPDGNETVFSGVGYIDEGSIHIVDDGTFVMGVKGGADRSTFAEVVHRLKGGKWRAVESLLAPHNLPASALATVIDSDAQVIALGAWEEAAYWEPSISGVHVYAAPVGDCNKNGVGDGCDIRDGTLTDCDANGVPDECESLPRFDFDFDGGVDLIDLAGFQRCFTGPGPAKLAPCCTVFDSEPDGDVDQFDFGAFLGMFAGP